MSFERTLSMDNASPSNNQKPELDGNFLSEMHIINESSLDLEVPVSEDEEEAFPGLD